MLIRKLFRFENAHIVRGCSTRRCSHSIHGHSYKVELLLEAHALDNGQMVYDFGLLKEGPRTLIDAFDHAVAIWSGDDPDYIAACQRFSERWIVIPVSPSAEQFSRLFFVLIDRLLWLTELRNGEADVRLHSVIVHETETGYAQCFREDAINPRMGLIALDDIAFSDAIRNDWPDPDLFDKLTRGERIANPLRVCTMIRKNPRGDLPHRAEDQPCRHHPCQRGGHRVFLRRRGHQSRTVAGVQAPAERVLKMADPQRLYRQRTGSCPRRFHGCARCQPGPVNHHFRRKPS